VGNLGGILSTDGGAVYLRHRRVFGEGPPEHHRMFASSAFTDATMFNRAAWIVDRARTAGTMVFRDTTAFGLEPYQTSHRGGLFNIGKESYTLFAMKLGDTPPGEMTMDRTTPSSRPSLGDRRPRVPILWHRPMPVRTTGMVLAGDRLFLAGAEDRFDPQDPLGMFEGHGPAVLWTIDPDTGETLAEMKLGAPPVWDGMSAAGGRLFIACEDGTIIALQ
jgi:hypothetical protein